MVRWANFTIMEYITRTVTTALHKAAFSVVDIIFLEKSENPRASRRKPVVSVLTNVQIGMLHGSLAGSLSQKGAGAKRLRVSPRSGRLLLAQGNPPSSHLAGDAGCHLPSAEGRLFSESPWVLYPSQPTIRLRKYSVPVNISAQPYCVMYSPWKALIDSMSPSSIR